MDMMKFKVTNRLSGEVRILTDRQLDEGHYDLRVWDIQKKKSTEDRPQPYSVLRVMTQNSEGETKAILFPVFSFADMDGLIITKSGHLFTKRDLSPLQKLWLDFHQESKSYGLL